MAIGFFLSGCVKDVEVVEKAPGSFSGNASDCLTEYDRTALYDGRILYEAQGQKEFVMNEVMTAVYYYGEADFGGVVQYAWEDVGVVSFGAIDKKNDPATNYGRNHYRFTKDDYTDGRNEKQFGAQTLFSISGGSSYGPSKTVVSVPKVILLDTVTTICNCKRPEVSVSSLPYRIKWNQDVLNDKGVAVKITYNGFSYENEGSALDSPFYRYNKIIVPDLGYYDITIPDLKVVPVGGVFEITVSRGNEGVITTNGKTINVEVYTKCDRNYRLIQ